MKSLNREFVLKCGSRRKSREEKILGLTSVPCPLKDGGDSIPEISKKFHGTNMKNLFEIFQRTLRADFALAKSVLKIISYFLFPLAVTGAITTGCMKPPQPKELPIKEINQKFLSILKEDKDFANASIKEAGKTILVYIPTTKNIFTYKATEAQKPSPKKFAVLYLNCYFRNDMFIIEYDIIPVSKTNPEQGITSGYSDDFNKKYRSLFMAISRAYLAYKNRPEFIVSVISDIKRGVEIINTMFLKDLIQYQTGALPYEEYQMRLLTKTNGAQSIIGDTEGKHLNVHDIAMGDFLAEQIKNRINFKYQRSDFPPQNDTKTEILTIVANTLHYYNFNDFLYIKLIDLRTKDMKLVGKKEVLSYYKEK